MIGVYPPYGFSAWRVISLSLMRMSEIDAPSGPGGPAAGMQFLTGASALADGEIQLPDVGCSFSRRLWRAI